MKAAKKNPIAGQTNRQRLSKVVRPTHRLVSAAALFAGFIAAGRASQATLVPLQDANSTVKLNTITDPSNVSAAGMTNWTVDSVNQLNQQTFWYRIGNSGPGATVGSLTQVGAPTVADTNGDGQNDYASVNYQGSGFTVNVQYLLTGGNPGSKVSDLTTTVRFVNTGASALALHLVDFTDYTLGNTPGSRTVSLTGSNTAAESNPAGARAETIVSPRSSEFEAASSASLFSGLNSGSLIPLQANTGNTGSDPAFAFEWDKTLGVGSSFVTTSDEQINFASAVPEPTSAAALLGIGALALTRPRRRDEDPDPRSAHVAGA